MSDTEYNSNMETIEGSEGAVYGGNNSGDFLASIKSNDIDTNDVVVKSEDVVQSTDAIKMNKVDGKTITVQLNKSFDGLNTDNANFFAANFKKDNKQVFTSIVVGEAITSITFTIPQLTTTNRKFVKVTDEKAIETINNNPEFKQNMIKILNHIIQRTPNGKVIAGSIDFVHPRFEMSLNTFGSLALYNKKKIDNDNDKKITDIDRSDGAAKGTNPLLKITSTAGVGSSPDITDDMKTLFKDFLTFFNFVITLLAHNKIFRGDEVEPPKTMGVAGTPFKDNLITFLTNKIYKMGTTTAYWPLLRILGHNEITKPKTGSPYKPDTSEWVHTGMKKTGNEWKYADTNATTENDAIPLESGFTLILDMLKEVEEMNKNIATNTMKIEIDLKEVCQLLAMLTQEKAPLGVKETLVGALLEIVNAPETATAPAEIYKGFLNKTYRGVLDILIDKAVEDETTTEVTKTAGELKLELNNAIDELRNVTGGLKVVARDLKDASKATEAGTATSAANDATSAAEKATEAEKAEDVAELTEALKKAKEALGIANGELQTANAVATNGGQKSKTLKRKQQQKNKTQRRFAYGGRKAYDQRKKQRQQKQN